MIAAGISVASSWSLVGLMLLAVVLIAWLAGHDWRDS